MSPIRIDKQDEPFSIAADEVFFTAQSVTVKQVRSRKKTGLDNKKLDLRLTLSRLAHNHPLLNLGKISRPWWQGLRETDKISTLADYLPLRFSQASFFGRFSKLRMSPSSGWGRKKASINGDRPCCVNINHVPTNHPGGGPSNIAALLNRHFLSQTIFNYWQKPWQFNSIPIIFRSKNQSISKPTAAFHTSTNPPPIELNTLLIVKSRWGGGCCLNFPGKKTLPNGFTKISRP